MAVISCRPWRGRCCTEVLNLLKSKERILANACLYAVACRRIASPAEKGKLKFFKSDCPAVTRLSVNFLIRAT